MMEKHENSVELRADAYSDRNVRMHKHLVNIRKETVLSKQILRRGTSIGANIAESINAQGPADFVNNLNISLKEADETYYWLKKLRA